MTPICQLADWGRKDSITHTQIKMKKTLYLLLLAALVALASCNNSTHREVDCRNFELTNELYWFSGGVGDSVIFTNATNRRIAFRIMDKSSQHTKRYTSETGCGCNDWSGMLLTDGVDSMWFYSSVKYAENQEGKQYEDVYIILHHEQSYFNETTRENLANYSIDTFEFSNIKKFEYSYTKPSQIKSVYMVKDLGVVQFKTAGGEVWTNTNLSTYAPNTINSFSYSENICD